MESESSGQESTTIQPLSSLAAELLANFDRLTVDETDNAFEVCYDDNQGILDRMVEKIAFRRPDMKGHERINEFIRLVRGEIASIDEETADTALAQFQLNLAPDLSDDDCPTLTVPAFTAACQVIRSVNMYVQRVHYRPYILHFGDLFSTASPEEIQTDQQLAILGKFVLAKVEYLVKPSPFIYGHPGDGLGRILTRQKTIADRLKAVQIENMVLRGATREQIEALGDGKTDTGFNILKQIERSPDDVDSSQLTLDRELLRSCGPMRLQTLHDDLLSSIAQLEEHASKYWVLQN